MLSVYGTVHERRKCEPEKFWGEAANLIDWFKPYDKIFDKNSGVYGRWFLGGKTNGCHNTVDRHVLNGHGHQVAIYYDGPVSHRRRSVTYNELLDEVWAISAFILDLGIKKGDRVLIYMPMVPQVFASVMACTHVLVLFIQLFLVGFLQKNWQYVLMIVS